MAADQTVVFDLSPTSSGGYYVAGEHVRHEGRVCVVQGVTRIAGTRFRATLHPVAHPTPAQRAAADEWQRTVTPGVR